MDKQFKKEMAERIKVLRNKSNLTQEKVAEKLDLTYNAYVKIENAYNAPSLKVLIKMSDVFCVPIDMIVFGNMDKAKTMLSKNELLDNIMALTDVEKLKHADGFLQKIIELLENYEHK